MSALPESVRMKKTAAFTAEQLQSRWISRWISRLLRALISNGTYGLTLRRESMDYKSKIEKTRQLRASVDAFLRKLAGQDEHLEIASNNIDTAIH